ncbi:hypothetical protein N9357_04080 [bacterium]|nr:hypothetical protein [bacterium]
MTIRVILEVSTFPKMDLHRKNCKGLGFSFPNERRKKLVVPATAALNKL